MIKLAADEGPAGIAREMLPKLVGETTKQLQPDLLEAVRRLIMMNSAEGITAALGALRDRPDSTPLLSAIEFPTLIIAGDEDAIVPVAEAEAMHRADSRDPRSSSSRVPGTCPTSKIPSAGAPRWITGSAASGVSSKPRLVVIHLRATRYGGRAGTLPVSLILPVVTCPYTCPRMDLQLAGKVAIVTGSSKGLGLASAHALAAEGARMRFARGAARR